MGTPSKSDLTYRSVILPGLGRVQVPDHLSDTEVLAEVLGVVTEATPERKIKKPLGN